MDNEDGNNNVAGGVDDVDEDIMRRNQVLFFGVILLGILSICLAVSMPSQLDFKNVEIPSAGDSIVTERDESVSVLPAINNLTNTTTTSETNLFKNMENSMESKLIRNIAIQKVMKELQEKNDADGTDGTDSDSFSDDDEDSNDGSSKEPNLFKEKSRVDQIVDSFMESEDFESFIIDIEIHDAMERLREAKGYKKRESTIFDDVFKEIERHFLGDDPEEVELIRNVAQEMERRAREIIGQRKKDSGHESNDQHEELIANQLINDNDYQRNEDDIVQ